MQQSLLELAAMINPENPVPAVPAIPAAPAAREVVDLDGENAVLATAEMVAAALRDGGRAQVTIRSRETGQHVKVLLTARKRRDGGEGFLPRTSRAGRVGIQDATVIEARDPEQEYPDNYVGRLYLDSNEWRAGRGADAKRVWAAEKVLTYALGGYDLLRVADVFLATQCSSCGRKLDDPTSIERGIGPECYGQVTGSRHAGYDR